MKTLYLVGGPMGVGKTSVCQLLKRRLDRCAFLDGDWCWDMDPFVVNDETKGMVLDNICFVLDRFLHCTEFENVVFCWVLHQQGIWDAILSRLDTRGWRVVRAALVASPEALVRRLQGDIAAGRCQPDVIPRSLARLPLYEKLDALQIDTSERSAEETAGCLAFYGRYGTMPSR